MGSHSHAEVSFWTAFPLFQGEPLDTFGLCGLLASLPSGVDDNTEDVLFFAVALLKIIWGGGIIVFEAILGGGGNS